MGRRKMERLKEEDDDDDETGLAPN